MNSNDGQDEEGYIDRMATHVYDPEEARSSPKREGARRSASAKGGQPLDRENTAPVIPNAPVPDERAKSPTTPGPYEEALGADDPTPPPTTPGPYEEALGADDPTPSPTAMPADAAAPSRQGRSAHDAEHLSNIGFIPGSNFKAPDDDGAATSRRVSPRHGTTRSITIAGRTFTLPSLTWLEDAEPMRRAQYAGMGLIAGAVIGGVLGILNAFLQGWSIAEGSGQLLALAVIFGVLCAAMTAMRPSRVDRLFEKLGIDG